MSAPEKNVVLGFKSYRANEYPPYLSKHQKKEFEHNRCRGPTPEEYQRLVQYGLEKKAGAPPKGAFVS